MTGIVIGNVSVGSVARLDFDNLIQNYKNSFGVKR